MDEVFLEIETAKFTAADLEKHQLSIPIQQSNSDLKIVFFNESDYSSYLIELEKKCDTFLSEYWLVKNSELIDKNKFIIKVLTVLKQEHAKKFNCSC